MAQAVQPDWLVIVEPSREQLRLPGSAGGFESLQLLQNRNQSVLTGQPGVLRDVLPSQEEPHEILCGDGLEAFPAGLLRVAVHACQQAPRYPLCVGCTRLVVALHSEALALEYCQPDDNLLEGQRGCIGQSFRSRNTCELEVTAHDANDRRMVACESVVGIGERLCRRPQFNSLVREDPAASAVDKRLPKA